MIQRTEEVHYVSGRLTLLVKIELLCIVGLLYDKASVGSFLVGLEDLIRRTY